MNWLDFSGEICPRSKVNELGLKCYFYLVTAISGELLGGFVSYLAEGYCPGGGGGGVTSNYVCILGMCRTRDPQFQPWISVPEHIIFTNYQKNPFRSITILHFLADFAIPETIIFKISLISTRSSPPTAGSARTPPRVSGRFGDSHFHAQNGSSSFRSPAFSRSTGSSFRSPSPFCILPRHIPTKIWGIAWQVDELIRFWSRSVQDQWTWSENAIFTSLPQYLENPLEDFFFSVLFSILGIGVHHDE